ncbi:MAG: hypothetical protein BWX80_03493 [Candidatus Hydrogenedentes bacterium ADurb.Bin101]|nr:MAG: hypothetical protein BWX80_03493 [Candidatus Hydrogenedentes bacterium ADurb.Bin101]
MLPSPVYPSITSEYTIAATPVDRVEMPGVQTMEFTISAGDSDAFTMPPMLSAKVQFTTDSAAPANQIAPASNKVPVPPGTPQPQYMLQVRPPPAPG